MNTQLHISKSWRSEFTRYHCPRDHFYHKGGYEGRIYTGTCVWRGGGAWWWWWWVVRTQNKASYNDKMLFISIFILIGKWQSHHPENSSTSTGSSFLWSKDRDSHQYFLQCQLIWCHGNHFKGLARYETGRCPGLRSVWEWFLMSTSHSTCSSM